MACVCVAGGGGCSVANTTVGEYLSAFGIPYNQNDPLPYKAALSVTKPAGLGSFSNFYFALGEACLRARALLFCNARPGDCGAPQQQGVNSLQLAGAIGGTGINVSSALTSGMAAAAGLSSVAAAATAGAGLILTVVLAHFQEHAAAEAEQSDVLCKLTPQFNASVANVDAAVFSGQADAGQAINTLQQLAGQFASADSHLVKSCNAFCVYNAIALAFAEISKYLYGVEPIPNGITASALTPPSTGEIPQSYAGIVGSPNLPAYVMPTSTIAPTIPSSIGNMPTLAIAAIVLVVILLLANRG